MHPLKYKCCWTIWKEEKVEKIRINANTVTKHPPRQMFEGTLENPNKCNPDRQFEGTFENAQWRKPETMQHCDFASSETGNLMFGIICYQLSSIIKTEGSFILFFWGFSSILTHHEDIPNLSEVPKFFLFQSEKWKFETIGNQWSIWLSLKQAFGHTRASASKEQMDNCDFGLKDATLKNMKETTDNVSKSKDKCNQSDFTSTHAGDFRRHLKTHSGEK